jgi:hypothetical protein
VYCTLDAHVVTPREKLQVTSDPWRAPFCCSLLVWPVTSVFIEAAAISPDDVDAGGAVGSLHAASSANTAIGTRRVLMAILLDDHYPNTRYAEGAKRVPLQER